MEAASSSSSDGESLASSQEEVPLRSRKEVGHSSRQGVDDSDSDDASSTEEDSSSQASSSVEEESSSDEEESRREELLPLAERIKRDQARGVDLKDRRERKQQALKVATERLHKAKKERKSKNLSEDTTKVKKKKSKHAPTEVSSKREDFYKRKVDLNENGIGVDIGAHRYKPRDPRVSNLNGHLDMEHFEKNYAFLQEMRMKEIKDLKKRISARKAIGTKGTERRRRLGITNDGRTLEDDKEELKRLLHEKSDFERRQLERAAKRSVKKRLQQEVADGKRGVYFPKRKELRKLHLEAKYDEIRRVGGDKAVDRAVAKRRKKNKSKDAGLLGGSRG